MNKTNFFACLLASAVIFSSCDKAKKEKEQFINENVAFAVAQTEGMLERTGEANGKNYPRTMRNNGELATTGMYDWTPGFFPGSLWYLYELTGDEQWKDKATEWTETLEPLKTFTGHHDLGFMMFCSYGNANRLNPNKDYEDIIVESAGSLSTRYNDKTKSIKSWNRFASWNDSTIYTYPVIVDNMMNLEMLLEATKMSGDSTYWNVAVNHANTAMKNQFRDDYTTYHVVAYDTLNGTNPVAQITAQGWSDNSMWARGQAWAIYGYTMMYKETGDKKYLDTAEKAANVYLKNLPEDLVPYWDFNIEQDGYTPGQRSYATKYSGKNDRDVSSAAIVCSALFDLGQLSGKKEYIDDAIKMLKILSTPEYRAELNENANFILKHSVGSIPHQTEIDKPLVYADYYYLEALKRYKDLK